MGRKIPPKGSTGKNIKKIVQQGPKPQPAPTLAKGPQKSQVAQVDASRKPKPSQNQRGKVKNLDGHDLTR